MEGIILGLFAIAVIALLVYLYLNHSYQAEEKQRLKKEFDEWRRKESESMRHEQTAIAQKAAMEQLQQWRQQEIESVRTEQQRIAAEQATVAIEKWKAEYEQNIRKDAIQKSQSVTLGKVSEHLIPFLPGFNYNPKDARFVGAPIDFVVFDGLSEDDVRRVVFIEVKTGKSALSTRERRIRDAVQAGKVEWVEMRFQPDGIESDSPRSGQSTPMLFEKGSERESQLEQLDALEKLKAMGIRVNEESIAELKRSLQANL